MALSTTARLILAPVLVSTPAARAEVPPDVRGVLREALEASTGAGLRRPLDGLPSALARAGDVATALKIAREMNGNATVLEEIAVAQAGGGDLKGALESVDSFADGFGKARALAQVAGVQADRGDAKGARETAAKIADDGGLAWARALIASAQAKAGQSEAALETAKAIGDDAKRAYLKVGALRDIALSQARAGKLPAALRTVAAGKMPGRILRERRSPAPHPSSLAIQQAWEELEELCAQAPLDSGGVHLSRDQLHERR
jgi:hypothetical protein